MDRLEIEQQSGCVDRRKDIQSFGRDCLDGERGADGTTDGMASSHAIRDQPAHGHPCGTHAQPPPSPLSVLLSCMDVDLPDIDRRPDCHTASGSCIHAGMSRWPCSTRQTSM